MGDVSPSSRGTILRREVESPRGPISGLGVMLVASTAMFFAVASSAFVIRARMPSQPCYHSGSNSAVVQTAPEREVEPTPCGEAIYQNNPDGTVSVVFEVCPHDLDIIPADGSPEPGMP